MFHWRGTNGADAGDAANAVASAKASSALSMSSCGMAMTTSDSTRWMPASAASSKAAASVRPLTVATPILSSVVSTKPPRLARRSPKAAGTRSPVNSTMWRPVCSTGVRLAASIRSPAGPTAPERSLHPWSASATTANEKDSGTRARMMPPELVVRAGCAGIAQLRLEVIEFLAQGSQLLLLPLNFIEQHRGQHVVHHGGRLTRRVVRHELGIDLGHLFGDEAVLNW